MNFGSETILSVSPNFMDLGLSSVNTMDELGSVCASITRIGSAAHRSDCPPCSRCIIDATTYIVIRTKANNHYNFKSEFEIRRDKVVDQYFGRQNDPTSRPHLELTTLGTNKANGTTLPSDLIPVRTQ